MGVMILLVLCCILSHFLIDCLTLKENNDKVLSENDSTNKINEFHTDKIKSRNFLHQNSELIRNKRPWEISGHIAGSYKSDSSSDNKNNAGGSSKSGSNNGGGKSDGGKSGGDGKSGGKSGGGGGGKSGAGGGGKSGAGGGGKSGGGKKG
ncbi:hypothetical protein HELRODRAFT_159461 [Helobdella robusta]|uniref:Uncharacterized protein n=1 Tax=Helobdella robusta TaxID=6412 RepID=T1EP22_HELRO|nr:hypothetical protein HELRODRAFT_159461 [Helobdella robusta]ESO12872.1 hypothetical protein HELRODRAFT_159461 [Helobdella robusta]